MAAIDHCFESRVTEGLTADRSVYEILTAVAAVFHGRDVLRLQSLTSAFMSRIQGVYTVSTAPSFPISS